MPKGICHTGCGKRVVVAVAVAAAAAAGAVVGVVVVVVAVAVVLGMVVVVVGVVGALAVVSLEGPQMISPMPGNCVAVLGLGLGDV